MSRKGVCANHIKDISGFFRGAHITINARTEDEVEPSVILEKVAKTSATKLCLKERSDPTDVPSRPVGTNYQRIQPQKEINSLERESFWHKQQEEERKRKIEERKRLEEERKKLEEAEKLREMKEAKERENAILKRETELAKRREEERNAKNESNISKNRPSYHSCLSNTNTNEVDEEDPDEERIKRVEAMKKARAEEARNLISGSNIRNARALFEQNTSTGQLSKPPLPKPIRSSINKSSSPSNIAAGSSSSSCRSSPSPTAAVSSSLNSSSSMNTNGSNKIANGSGGKGSTGSSKCPPGNESLSMEKSNSPLSNLSLRNGNIVAGTTGIFTATAVAGAAATTAILSSNKSKVNECSNGSNKQTTQLTTPLTTMGQKNTTSSIISGTNILTEDTLSKNAIRHDYNSSSSAATTTKSSSASSSSTTKANTTSLSDAYSAESQERHGSQLKMKESASSHGKVHEEEEEEEEDDEDSSYLDDPRVAAALSAASQQQRLYEHPVDHTLEDIAEECEDVEDECNSGQPNVHLGSSVIPDSVKNSQALGIRARALYDYQAGGLLG